MCAALCPQDAVQSSSSDASLSSDDEERLSPGVGRRVQAPSSPPQGTDNITLSTLPTSPSLHQSPVPAPTSPPLLRPFTSLPSLCRPSLPPSPPPSFPSLPHPHPSLPPSLAPLPLSLSPPLLFRCTIQSRADRLLIRQEQGMARKPVFDPAKVSESPAAHVLKVRNVTRCF
jgi:hypothetical protein